MKTVLAIDHDPQAIDCYRLNVPEAERVVCGGLGAVGWHGRYWSPLDRVRDDPGAAL